MPVLPRIPTIFTNLNVKPPRGEKEIYRLQGEEIQHNKLVLEQYGIVAIHAGMMKHAHFEVLRNEIGRQLEPEKSFAIYRVDPPYKPVTFRGQGKKMGGGKGSISHYATPVKAGRVIVEVGGKVIWEEVQPWLNKVAQKMPFMAMAVTQDMINRLDAEEARLEEANLNPYTFEWLVRNNMFDCHRHLSHKDRLWFGKFVYRDRSLNLKWNIVRQKKYKHR